MALAAKIADPAFEGAGQNYGTEIWRIENFEPVPLPKSDHGKFYTGDSYIVMHTSSGADTGRGAYVRDIHYWIGKKSTQDEYGAVAMKAAELDELLGGSPTLHREIQGEESDKFLSYFKPCIVPLEGGFASGFNHHEEDKFEPLLYACHEKNEITRVTQFQVARSSLNHDAVFFLITESKIFEFMGKTANVSEKIKATEVLEHLKETFHVGRTCKFVVIDDKNSVEDPDSSEFWGYFGGFASIATVEGSKDAPKAQEVAEEEKTDIL